MLYAMCISIKSIHLKQWWIKVAGANKFSREISGSQQESNELN